jgi:pimeloyl-ACP methyl ester carboxylesterase
LFYLGSYLFIIGIGRFVAPRGTLKFSNPAGNAPVRLVWGAEDWARPGEREHDQSLIPGAEVVTARNGGHFLPLDRPDAVIEQINTSANPNGMAAPPRAAVAVTRAATG